MSEYRKPELFVLGDAAGLIKGRKIDFQNLEPNLKPGFIMEADLDN